MSPRAVEAPTTVPSEADVAAVRDLGARVMAAWNAADADAFAALFTVDATLVGDLYMTGRETIAATMAGGFEGPFHGTTLTVEPVDLRFLRSDVAVLLTRGELSADGAAGGPEFLATTTAVRTDDGRWEIAAYQNAKGTSRIDATEEAV